jgi:hypothetical protein
MELNAHGVYMSHCGRDKNVIYALNRLKESFTKYSIMFVKVIQYCSDDHPPCPFLISVARNFAQ